MRLSLRLAAFAILMAAALAQQVPRPAGEFVVNFGGGQLLLSQFSGKVVLLAFLYTT
jgi:hypothetical protein